MAYTPCGRLESNPYTPTGMCKVWKAWPHSNIYMYGFHLNLNLNEQRIFQSVTTMDAQTKVCVVCSVSWRQSSGLRQVLHICFAASLGLHVPRRNEPHKQRGARLCGWLRSHAKPKYVSGTPWLHESHEAQILGRAPWFTRHVRHKHVGRALWLFKSREAPICEHDPLAT